MYRCLAATDMQDRFVNLANGVAARLQPGEGFLARYAGEKSRFVRFNRAAIRQAGTVEQRYLALELFDGRRHASQTLSLTGNAEDEARIDAAISELREILASAPEDPHFLVSTSVQSTIRDAPDRLPPDDAAVASILDNAAGADFVGFYATGPVHHGFANSFGQRNWSTVHSFSLDACLYAQGDKAVKTAYAGAEWHDDAVQAKFAEAKAKLAILERPAKTIAPGEYRVFLAPAAMEEVLGLLSWGGFSLAAHRTATTPLIRLARGEVALSPLVTLAENTGTGLAPGFQSEGFVKPDSVTLIESGQYKDCLASPRAAKEFDTVHNAADSAEMPGSLDMAPGTLPDSEILSALGTGLLIGNLWYLNYSDRNACRLTGMTRFASFWVENGNIVAPVNVMRFDDSLYRMLGSNLIALTAAREYRLSTDTYERRSTASMRVPGALIDGLRLTL